MKGGSKTPPALMLAACLLLLAKLKTCDTTSDCRKTHEVKGSSPISFRARARSASAASMARCRTAFSKAEASPPDPAACTISS